MDYPYYELLWQVDQNATRKFIEAYWSGHVIDWSNLDFNRYTLYSDSREEPWNHEYRGGPVFFQTKDSSGQGIFTTGTSLTHAGATLYLLSGNDQSLVWSKRLIQRFIDTRHPSTGISAYKYNQPRRSFVGGDVTEHFTDSRTGVFPFYPFAVMRNMYYPEDVTVHQWLSVLLIGDMLGEQGREFTAWVLEELTAWGKASYRERDNAFVPILTDGIHIEGIMLKEDSPLGLKGSIAEPLFADAGYFWLYATAYRATDNEFMWQMVRNIAKGNNFGDIGEVPGKKPEFKLDTTCSDVYSLLGFLELYNKTKKQEFLVMARRIADNIVVNQFHRGFFVFSKDHIYTRFDCFEPLALLHLVATIESQSESVPRVWPSSPLFIPPYRYKQEGEDRRIFYTLTESSEVPLSLQEAAHIGDIDLVRTLLKNGTKPDSLDDGYHLTALHRAAIAGHKDIAELLISYGARVDHVGYKSTPLHCAIQYGHRDVVELLLAHGADVNIKDDWGRGKTPLGIAIDKKREDIIKLLLDNGADMNVKDKQGRTPLDYARQGKDKETIKLFSTKVTSVYQAVQLGDLARAEALLEQGADVNAKDEKGRTPLLLAVQEGHKEVVEVLVSKKADVNAKDNKGMTPLHLAAQRDYNEVADLLISKGADVNAKNDSGETPLDIGGYSEEIARLLISAGARTSSIHNAARFGLLSEVKRFLEEGVDVNTKNEDGITPLHLAAQAGRKDVMELLIAKGADVNARNSKGQTPLHIARQVDQETFKELMDLLLSNGADLNAKDDSGCTLLDDVALGRSAPELFDFLLSKGADANNIHFAAYQGDIGRVKSYLKEGVDINEKRTTRQRTPLDYAVKGGKVEVVRLLISEGADISAGDKDTPVLIQAVISGNTEIAGLLLDNGADPDTVGSSFRMPVLHTAVVRGNKEMVKLLLEKGADMNAKGLGGTALDLAKRFKKTEMIDLLKKHGANE